MVIFDGQMRVSDCIARLNERVEGVAEPLNALHHRRGQECKGVPSLANPTKKTQFCPVTELSSLRGYFIEPCLGQAQESEIAWES